MAPLFNHELVQSPVGIYADPRMQKLVPSGAGPADALRAFFSLAGPSDYLGLLAFLPRFPRYDHELQRLRLMVRNHLRIATTVQFGPRYLHSVGQVFKGGPLTGLFLVLTCDDSLNLAVPDKTYSFGTVKYAQAQGDLHVLRARGQRTLRIHLGREVKAALESLHPLFRHALDHTHPMNNQVNTNGLNREFSRLNPLRKVGGTQ